MTIFCPFLMHFFQGMGFIIKKIVVHKKPTEVREGEVHYNMDRATWDVRNLLEVFSREFTHKDFCLAHLFTDIKFEGGILGMNLHFEHKNSPNFKF